MLHWLDPMQGGGWETCCHAVLWSLTYISFWGISHSKSGNKKPAMAPQLQSVSDLESRWTNWLKHKQAKNVITYSTEEDAAVLVMYVEKGKSSFYFNNSWWMQITVKHWVWKYPSIYFICFYTNICNQDTKITHCDFPVLLYILQRKKKHFKNTFCLAFVAVKTNKTYLLIKWIKKLIV